MSMNEHNRPHHRGGDWLGELFILVAILFVGLALMVALSAAGSPQSAPADIIVPAPTAAIAAANPVVRTPAPPSSPIVNRAPVATPSSHTSATPRTAVTPSVATPAATEMAAAPQITVTPTPRPSLPAATEIKIPSVGIDTKVVNVGSTLAMIDGTSVRQMDVAAYAAGHDALSANPGEGGNIVISGHDDWKGEVFKNLHDVKTGEQILLVTPQGTHRYTITEIVYRKITGTSLKDQLAAGQYLAPMPEERVTLVTCWPYGVDTHRLIVVAKPG